MGFWDAVASAGPHANNQCYSTEGKTEGILHFLLPVTSVLPMAGHMKISDFGLSHILCCSFFFLLNFAKLVCVCLAVISSTAFSHIIPKLKTIVT